MKRFEDFSEEEKQEQSDEYYEAKAEYYQKKLEELKKHPGGFGGRGDMDYPKP